MKVVKFETHLIICFEKEAVFLSKTDFIENNIYIYEITIRYIVTLSWNSCFHIHKKLWSIWWTWKGNCWVPKQGYIQSTCLYVSKPLLRTCQSSWLLNNGISLAYNFCPAVSTNYVDKVTFRHVYLECLLPAVHNKQNKLSFQVLGDFN